VARSNISLELSERTKRECVVASLFGALYLSLSFVVCILI
jgi:hypothetical protein